MPASLRNFTIACALVLSACGPHGHSVRHYREIVLTPDMPPPAASAGSDMSGPVETGNIQLAWTAPEGWIEKPASGPRLATFAVGDAECSIVSFPGDAGGVMANLKRWIGQLKADVPDDKLEVFSAGAESMKSNGGFGVVIYDFSSVLPADTATSMIAAMVPAGGQTIFVKLMGPVSLLAAEKEHFKALCASLHEHSGESSGT